MTEQNKTASPELMKRMKNITAQAEAAKHWISKKHQEEMKKEEEKVHEKEINIIEEEINNL